MKKLFILLITIVSVVTACAFAGCGNGKITKTEIDEKTCYVITVNDLTADVDTSVADYLLSLRDKGELNFEGSVTEYGLYIKSVDGLAEKYSEDFSSGSYWSLYLDFTELERDDAIYADGNNICEYKGKTYYYANYGFSGIPCMNEHTYILAYVSYGG